MSDQLHCPKCNSTQVTAQKHGFSAGKAVAGAVLTGGVGLLAGLHGSSDIDITCLQCGYKWNPKKLAEERRREVFQDLKVWKRSFYAAYENKQYEQAEIIYKVHSTFNKTTPDVHSAYRFHKRNDQQGVLFLIVLIAIILTVVYFIA